MSRVAPGNNEDPYQRQAAERGYNQHVGKGIVGGQIKKLEERLKVDFARSREMSPEGKRGCHESQYGEESEVQPN
jgi:hypothetical protein